ncbi:DUF1203 domain-containing protein [Rhodospirillaceae bacterium KN72]|uniref:DUF1203 domain-containing protein n=1 Tax=Pacificispira spongiicola TaxID=2729598 RepID=A0A7Y0DXS1_9PROT|nr:DUF1203 domain-containing protein [Pacificispira spongiicola]NMM43526.1 DUF1203 domain-containing protein [Pacificispira spongiicola]
MTFKFVAMDTDTARHYQRGGTDAYGHKPEHQSSDGVGNPCRHCLQNIPEGADMLVLAHRPFPGTQPYAETGPIFLCGAECDRHPVSEELPDLFRDYEDILIRGYDANDRIRYGTGEVVSIAALPTALAARFENPDVAYVHMRSSRNNCFQCRVERA